MVERRKISFPDEEYLLKLLRSVVTQTLSESYPQATKEIYLLKEKLEEHINSESQKYTEMINILKEVRDQAKITNGRVTKLEAWKTATVNYAKGVQQGGKWVWGSVAFFVGVLWILFGDVIKNKFI
jgi:hypothetical protein